MTPVESMFEIKAAVLGLEKYLLSKDAVVLKRQNGGKVAELRMWQDLRESFSLAL